jgi:hypothetical protein
VLRTFKTHLLMRPRPSGPMRRSLDRRFPGSGPGSPKPRASAAPGFGEGLPLAISLALYGHSRSRCYLIYPLQAVGSSTENFSLAPLTPTPAGNLLHCGYRALVLACCDDSCRRYGDSPLQNRTVVGRPIASVATAKALGTNLATSKGWHGDGHAAWLRKGVTGLLVERGFGMREGSLRPLKLVRGPTGRACIQCGSLFSSREVSHRVCQACRHRFGSLRLVTRFDPWLSQPSRGRWVEGYSTLS